MQHKVAASAQDPRVCLALERCTIGVMVVDERNRVIYVNDAAEQLFCRHEAQIRATVADFDARNIVGTDVQPLAGIDPGSCAGHASTRVEDRQLGCARLQVSISPMVDTQGRHWGAVLEWNDRTVEVSPAGVVHSPEQQPGGDTTGLRQMDQLLRQMTGVMEEMARKANRYAQHADQASGAVIQAQQRVMRQGRIAEEVTASTARWFRQVGDVSREIGDILRMIEETTARGRLLLTDTTTARKLADTQNERRIPVAEEMLSLATLSVNAAQVAKQLIDGLARRATDSSELVTRNASGFGTLFDSLDEAGALVTEVAAVAHEHSQEVLEVSRKIAALCHPKEPLTRTLHNPVAGGNSVLPFKQRVPGKPPRQAR